MHFPADQRPLLSRRQEEAVLDGRVVDREKREHRFPANIEQRKQARKHASTHQEGGTGDGTEHLSNHDRERILLSFTPRDEGRIRRFGGPSIHTRQSLSLKKYQYP